jgi:hypothetical protein
MTAAHLRRHGDDHVIDRWMRTESVDTALEESPAADVQQLLRDRRAEPSSTSSRGDDRGHMHGR